MKKRMLSGLICLLLIIGSMSGCAAATGDDEGAQADHEMQEPAGWFVSDLMGNVTADTQVQAEDDFHAAVNKDWLATAEIPQGYTNANPFVDRESEVKEQILALMTDDTQTSHEAELVRTLYSQYTDMDKRNGLGVEPLLPYIDAIMELETIEDVREYVIDYENNLSAMFTSVSVTAARKDSRVNKVYLGAPGFSLGDADEYRSMTAVGERQKNADETAIVSLLVHAGLPETEAQGIYEDFFALESRIAQPWLRFSMMRAWMNSDAPMFTPRVGWAMTRAD